MPLNLSPTQVAFNARGDGKFNKPFQEQVDFFRKKLNLPTEHWDDILKSAHDRAFIVAGAAKADLLTDLRAAVDKSIANGKSIQWFKKEFAGIVQQHGWEGWTGSDTKDGRDWRTRVIYNTNLSSSYAAGRYQQQIDPDSLKIRPYWKYIHSDTVAHPRELHQSWNGLVLKYDDPWWQTHFPPNGFGCQCRTKSVSASEYKGHPPPDDGTYEKQDRWGNVHTLPEGVDYGWDYAPGASVSESLQTYVDNKVKALPKPLGDAFKDDVSRIKPKPLEFTPAKTAREAGNWAVENNLVDYADYGSVNVAVANDMNKSLLDHIKEFPELRKNQKFIGTAQLQFKRWQQLESKSYFDRLIANGYAPEMAKKWADKFYKTPKVNAQVLMHSWSQPVVSGVAVNQKFGKNLPGFLEALNILESSKFHPEFCNTIKSVVDHEFGHQLDDLIGLTAADKKAGQSAISKLYAEALAVGIKDNLSEYAGKNIKEFVAEAWSEALNNKSPRHFATEVARIIRDEYAKKFPS